MAIEKKSLINTLKTTKKANVASAPATNEGVSTRKAAKKVSMKMRRMRRID
jgi:ribosome biogenesis GTPase A